MTGARPDSRAACVIKYVGAKYPPLLSWNAMKLRSCQAAASWVVFAPRTYCRVKPEVFFIVPFSDGTLLKDQSLTTFEVAASPRSSAYRTSVGAIATWPAFKAV